MNSEFYYVLNERLHILLYTAFFCIELFVYYKLCMNQFKKWGWPSSRSSSMLIWTIFWGLICGRIFVILFNIADFIEYPQKFFAIWYHDFSLLGMLIGGFSYLVFRMKNLPASIARIMDVIGLNLFIPLVIKDVYCLLICAIPSMMASYILQAFCELAGYWYIQKKYIQNREWKTGDIFWISLLWISLSRIVFLGLFPQAILLGDRDVLLPFINAFIMCVTSLLGITGLLGKWFHLPKKNPAMLFDLDGTLVDTRPLVFETFREVFKQLKPDYDLSEDELYSFFGPTLEDTFSRYFPEDQIEDVIELYQKINLSLHDDMIKIMPGAKEVLESLKQEEYPVAIVSNKRKKVVERGLKQAGLEEYCDVVLGKEDLPKPKPFSDGLIAACDALSVCYDNVIYVGDNTADVQAAKNMAAYSIAFSNDEKQRQALQKASACQCIMDLTDILKILQEDQEWIDKSIW